MIFLLTLGKQCHQSVSQEELDTDMRTLGNTLYGSLRVYGINCIQFPTIGMVQSFSIKLFLYEISS